MSQLAAAIENLDRAVAELREAARADDKTPLLNALALRQDAEKALDDIESPALLVFGDINRFKAVNEQHGHLAGDAAISHVGTALKDIADRCKGWAYRQSGDEFVVLIPQDAIGAFAGLASESLSAAVFSYEGAEIEVAMSFGYDVSEDEGFEARLRKAEEACTLAKQADGSTRQWTPELQLLLPVHDRMQCMACRTKFECWRPPEMKERGTQCPGCGQVL